MAEYKGYLLKINGTELPGQYIQDYSSTPNQAQDKDSYQDLTGELHREILPHTRSKIEFKTPPMSLHIHLVNFILRTSPTSHIPAGTRLHISHFALP